MVTKVENCWVARRETITLDVDIPEGFEIKSVGGLSFGDHIKTSITHLVGVANVTLRRKEVIPVLKKYFRVIYTETDSFPVMYTRGPGVAVRGLEEDSDELKKVMDNMCRRMRAGEVESFHLEEVT